MIANNTTTEATMLAEVYADVRSLTKFYLAKMRYLDPFKQHIVEDVKLNTMYWICSHLVWAEHFLIIEGLGGEKLNIPWMKYYAFGTQPSSHADLPEFQDVLKQMDIVHERALEGLRSLPDDQLDEPNELNLAFAGKNSKRKIIHHAIRHEPTHVGQLGWICKINGIKTL